jgi:5-methylcytosine-specific restriction protein A
VDRAAVQHAIIRFKRGERSEHWREGSRGWQEDDNHKYAVLQGNELFPVKEIIRLALDNSGEAGFADFSGGRQANSYLRARDFQIVALR